MLDEGRGQTSARDRFETLFGSLRGDLQAWLELECLRRSETKRLNRIASSAR